MAGCGSEAPPRECVSLGPAIEIAEGKLDVLFVVSTRDEMAAERAAIADALPSVLTGLARGDVDRDGVREGPLLDVQVGIVSAYIGTAGHETLGCVDTEVGENGLLRVDVVGDVAGCTARYDAVARGDAASDESAWIGPACLIRGLPRGCDFQQPILAAIKAVAPAATPAMTEVNPSTHGDRENAALFRQGAGLAVIFVVDRDDCSPQTDYLFRDGSVIASVDRQCRLDEERALMPIARTAAPALAALRPHAPRSLFIGVLGPLVPAESPAFTSEAALDQRGAASVEDPMTLQPFPVCETADGPAYPAPRVMEAANAVGDDSVATSICADVVPQLGSLLQRAAARADPCLPSMDVLNNSTGSVEDISEQCILTEALPTDGPITRCSALAASGRDSSPLRSASGREVCRIARVDAPSGEAGWFLDSSSAEVDAACAHRSERLRIAFTPGAEPPAGALLRLECPVPAEDFGCVWPRDDAPAAWRSSVRDGDDRCSRLCQSDTHCAVGELCDRSADTEAGRCRPASCE